MSKLIKWIFIVVSFAFWLAIIAVWAIACD